MKRLIFVILMFLSQFSYGQGEYTITGKDYQNTSVQMADALRASGKIYIVVAVMLTLLIILFVYLWYFERKIKKLENQVNDILSEEE